MTISQALKLFLKDRAVYCSEKTLAFYPEHLMVFFRYLEDAYQKSVNQLSFDDFPPEDNIFTDFVLYLRTGYKTRKNGVLKNSSIRSYARAVRAFLRFCYEENLCRDYLKKVKLPKDDAIPPEPLLAEEVKRIDAALNLETLKGIRNYCVMHLMLDCGLRTEEVLHLERQDIDQAHNILHIRISKECKSRITLIPDFVIDNIDKYLSMCNRDNDMGPIFHSLLTPSELMTSNTIRAAFQKLKKITGINRLHAHLLRHTFATSYLIGGGNLEYLRVFLGHYDYTVTKGYSSLAAQYRMLGLEIYKLDDIFFRIKGY